MPNIHAKESVKNFLAGVKTTVTPELFRTIRRGYSKKSLISDLMSGLIVGILALPLAIAFAIASGVGPEQGLYTAIIAGFTISLLGGSRFQIGGPTGAFIVIVYGIVSQYGYDGLASATLLAGILLIIFGLAKFGAIIKFIPYPVTVGFTAGIAIIIALGQVPNFFGLRFLSKDPADAVGKIKLYASSIDTVNIYAVIVGLVALAVCILWPKITTKVPGSLIAIIVATVLVKVLGWDDPITGHGVVTIGMKNHIPSGFPVPHLPNISLEMMQKVFQPALTIAILGAIESLLSAVVADGMTSTKHRSNTELFGQGVANVLSPMFGGIPATGAIARTATNIRNGAVSPISGLVHAVVLLLIMLVLGKYAEMIPMAALAAVLFQVAFNMCGYRSFIKMFKAPKSDIAVMLVAFFLTVIIDLTVAIEVGVLLAAVLFIKRMSDVSEMETVTEALKEDDEEAAHNDLSRQVPKGVVVYELAGSLFFGAVDKFKDHDAVQFRGLDGDFEHVGADALLVLDLKDQLGAFHLIVEPVENILLGADRHVIVGGLDEGHIGATVDLNGIEVLEVKRLADDGAFSLDVVLAEGVVLVHVEAGSADQRQGNHIKDSFHCIISVEDG